MSGRIGLQPKSDRCASAGFTIMFGRNFITVIKFLTPLRIPVLPELANYHSDSLAPIAILSGPVNQT